MSETAGQFLPSSPPVEALSRQFGLPEQLSGAESSDARLRRRSVRVGSYALLFPIELLGEVVHPAPPIYAIPNVASWMRGLINMRGNVTPVVDLAPLLGTDTPERRKLFVVGEGEAMVGFFIDDFPRVVQMNPEDEIAELPISTMLDKFTDRFFLADEAIWLDLRLDAMFAGLADQMSA